VKVVSCYRYVVEAVLCYRCVVKVLLFLQVPVYVVKIVLYILQECCEVLS
jgi:hypothetical protein